MLLMNFELELLEANLLYLSCWLHCVLKIRLSAYKLEYEHECLHFVFALFFLFLCFSFCWCQKGGEINELVRERDKKGRIVNIGYECIYWGGAYNAYWYIFYVCISLERVFLIHLISVLSSSKKGRLLSPCLILMIPKHSYYNF